MSDLAERNVATIQVSLGRPRILIVDDDEDFLQSAQELFSARGFDVDTARTPEAATKMLKENGEDKYQVVATDINFGGSSDINGDQFVLQNPSLFGKAKTVVFTGGAWLTPERRKRLENAGISFLEKSPSLVHNLEELTEMENQKQTSDILTIVTARIEELTGRRVSAKVMAAPTASRATLSMSDIVGGELKRTLVGWLRSRDEPDRPILAYGKRTYSANEMAEEVPNETQAGLAHVQMLVREFNQSLASDMDDQSRDQN